MNKLFRILSNGVESGEWSETQLRLKIKIINVQLTALRQQTKLYYWIISNRLFVLSSVLDNFRVVFTFWDSIYIQCYKNCHTKVSLKQQVFVNYYFLNESNSYIILYFPVRSDSERSYKMKVITDILFTYNVGKFPQ